MKSTLVSLHVDQQPVISTALNITSITPLLLTPLIPSKLPHLTLQARPRLGIIGLVMSMLLFEIFAEMILEVIFRNNTIQGPIILSLRNGPLRKSRTNQYLIQKCCDRRTLGVNNNRQGKPNTPLQEEEVEEEE